MQPLSHSPAFIGISPTVRLASRSFGSKKNKNQQTQQQQPKKKSKVARRAAKRKSEQKEREQRERKQYGRDRIAKLKRQKNLHKAGKMKRVLSSADFWFSNGNLMNDTFLKDQLRAHKGYVPLTVLLKFPRFEYWTDLPLLYETFTNPAAKRYQVIIDEQLVQNGQERLERLEREREEEVRRQKNLHRERQRREEELLQRREQIYNERLQKLIDEKRPEVLKERNEEIAQERAQIIAARRAEYAKDANSIRGMLERRRENSTLVNKILDVWEKSENIEEKWDLPPYFTIDDIDDDMVYVSYDFEAQYYDYLLGYDEEEEEVDDHDAEDPYGRHMQQIEEGSSLTEEDKTDDADFLDDPNGEGEGRDMAQSTDIQHALVRHRRVNLESILDMERDGMNLDDIGQDYGDTMESDVDEEEIAVTKEKKGHSTFRKYSTRRQSIIISTPKKLAKFCARLKVDVQRASSLNEDNPDASAVGFDLEYATLELDIRNTLPAMVQLAGPTTDSQVGLIWLDKFPDHARSMLGEEEAQPLMDILADASILKVGVGATKDAKHLAAWWGITDRDYVGDFISGVVDIDGEIDDASFEATEMNLAKLCETVLERQLPKRKQKVSSKNKKRKRQGRSAPTAHWRVSPGQITQEMKEYAANDAASGIDIWMKLKGLEQE